MTEIPAACEGPLLDESANTVRTRRRCSQRSRGLRRATAATSQFARNSEPCNCKYSGSCRSKKYRTLRAVPSHSKFSPTPPNERQIAGSWRQDSSSGLFIVSVRVHIDLAALNLHGNSLGNGGRPIPMCNAVRVTVAAHMELGRKGKRFTFDETDLLDTAERAVVPAKRPV